MSKLRVYIETTIPSFYHEIRQEPEMVARRGWTREWWDERRSEYEVFTSDAVVDELERGNFPIKLEALQLIEHLPQLEINQASRTLSCSISINRLCLPIQPAMPCIWHWLRITNAISC